MQTRSFSKAFRKTILRLWWIPFFFAALAGPIVYTQHEILGSGFVTTGKILLDVPDGTSLEKSVIQEHELILQSSVMQNRARDLLAQKGSQSVFTEISIDTVPVKNSGIIAVTCRGANAEYVRELLSSQFELYVNAIDSHRRDGTPQAGALDLANVHPRILEWPGPAVESTKMQGIRSALIASLMGGFAGIALMLFISGIWAFFRPARLQPSLDEIMKAAEGLDASERVALLERLVGEWAQASSSELLEDVPQQQT